MTPTIAQEAVAPETSTATVADDPVAAIPGIWIRDERLSEDPIEKLEETYGQTFGGGPVRSPGANPGSGRSGGFGRGGFGRGRPGGPPGGTQDGPSGMREMARELAERLDVLLIRIDDPQLLIRNAKREDRILYLDGRDIADGFGGHSRARLLGRLTRGRNLLPGPAADRDLLPGGKPARPRHRSPGRPLRRPVVPHRLRALGRRTRGRGTDLGVACVRGCRGAGGRLRQGGLPAGGRRRPRREPGRALGQRTQRAAGDDPHPAARARLPRAARRPGPDSDPHDRPADRRRRVPPRRGAGGPRHDAAVRGPDQARRSAPRADDRGQGHDRPGRPRGNRPDRSEPPRSPVRGADRRHHSR